MLTYITVSFTFHHTILETITQYARIAELKSTNVVSVAVFAANCAYSEVSASFGEKAKSLRHRQWYSNNKLVHLADRYNGGAFYPDKDGKSVWSDNILCENEQQVLHLTLLAVVMDG